MFWGKWNVTIDTKWRLNIPAALSSQVDNFVLLYENDEGCVQIRIPSFNVNNVNEVSIYLVEVKGGRGKHNARRILFPKALRRSTSFFYGRRVTLVGKGEYLELWPRPQNPPRERR